MTNAVKIYITHCCAKKDDTLRQTGRRVPPEDLYIAKPTKKFIQRCKNANAQWAIFSDKYGIWFPDKLEEWYEKHPRTVSESEFQKLVTDFDSKLAHPARRQ